MPPLSRPSRFRQERLPYPQCEWLPEYSINESPYNEDEIVRIITELYELLVKLCYLPEDQVAWPPARGHDINLALAEELELEPAVISLMGRLPYTSKLGSPGLDPFIIFPDARPYNFLYDRDIRESRSPREYGYNGQECHETLLPQDLCLTAATFQANDDGEYAILDTRQNVVRIISSKYKPNEMSPPGTRLEKPNEPEHYRNNFPRHAPLYLQRQVDQLQNLDVIPSTPQWGNGFVSSRLHPDIYHRIKSILVEKFGWPYNYQREAWARDRDAVWDKVVKKVYDPTDTSSEEESDEEAPSEGA